jgi:hypothetical protein
MIKSNSEREASTMTLANFRKTAAAGAALALVTTAAKVARQFIASRRFSPRVLCGFGSRIGGGPTAGRAGLHRTSPDRCVDRVEGKTRPNRTQIESIESGKDMTNRKQMSFLSLTLLAASLALPAMAQTPKPRLTEFDAPGAGTVSSPECAPSCGTLAYANNIEGAIVGYYTDTNIVPHAFLRTRDGQITSFDAPGAGLALPPHS